ncbi:two-component system activity regulator YycH, partial [Staphylococcus chromogenes]
ANYNDKDEMYHYKNLSEDAKSSSNMQETIPGTYEFINSHGGFLEKEKIKACQLSEAAGAHFVKTSTGFAGGGATVEDVKLMKDTVGYRLEVKASGGVRNLEDFNNMIEAGATRIGASAGVQIIQGLESNTDY